MTVYLREDVEFVHPIPKKYSLRTTIQHWQLRDLITCPSQRKEIAYVHSNNVWSFDTETQQGVPLLQDMSFAPTCLSSGCGYVAVGGQRSQLMVKHLETNWFAQTTVSGSINNSICISQHLNGTRMLICNNDESIKIYSLPDMQRIGTITFPTAVNNCSVSPDGKKMIAVGDSNQVFMYNIDGSSGSAGYSLTGTLTGSSDAGFSCAWNQSSDKFAVGSQDGFVSVWDIRSSEKITKISSKQNGHVRGACRSVKFTQSGSIDLLLFSEHLSYVNVVDARTFNMRQSVRVAPQGVEAHISGIGISNDSQRMYVGELSFTLGLENCILDYQIDTMARRSFPEGSII